MKKVKRKEDPRLQNYLAEGHVAARKEVWSLIPSELASQML